VTRLQAGQLRNGGSVPVRREFFLLSESSTLAPGSTQPFIQCVLGNLSLGVKQLGVKLITHFHLVPRLRVGGSILPLPLKPSWHV
jgi:hypothetical protein